MTPAEPTLNKTSQNDTQSVFVPEKSAVVNYPRTMSNEQIQHDVHTRVKGNSEEDYFVNFQPQKMLVEGLKAAGDYFKYGQNAMKLWAIRPDVASGLSKDITPEQLQETYKSWYDLWRESPIGGAISKKVEKFAADHSVAGYIPWFVAEFAPGEMLDSATRPSSWVGAYGIQKFGPPIINKILSKLPESVRKPLLTNLFEGEAALAKEFETLGLKPNAKSSAVTKSFRDLAKQTHPDMGGNADKFMEVNQAYDKIMQSRNGALNKFYDLFRTMPEAAESAMTRKPLPVGFRKAEAIIPFDEGDLVRVSGKVGQVIKVSGEMATVNVGGKISEVALSKIKPHEKSNPPQSVVNLEHIQSSDDAKAALYKSSDIVKEELEKRTGGTLTHDEVLEKAKTVELLTKGASREETLTFEAELLKTRQHLAALAENQELTPEFIDTLKKVSEIGTKIGRQLESFKIDAMPEYATVKTEIVKKLLDIGMTADEIAKAAQGVDFKNTESVANFYRQYIKPTLKEQLDEFAYVNILSSPKTHIVNTFSNMIQLAGLSPLTKLATGAVDAVYSGLTGAEREYYMSEIPSFYKGAINAVPKAWEDAMAAMGGKAIVERPDIKSLPTKAKWIDYATLGLGKYITRALEAEDIFFRTMIYEGEKEALTSKYAAEMSGLDETGKEKKQLQIEKEAMKKAYYYVFRTKPDAKNKSGQGDFLSAIDAMTNEVYRLRELPGAKWFIRFVQTPMNILKQGFEYSPAGFATIKGAKDKKEQIGKAMVGSLVFAGASYVAMNGKSTWAVPKGKKERSEFYAAGMQPYSLKIGGKWVSYSKLGPLAYPIAMAAALHYYMKDSPDALSDSDMEKATNALGGIMQFFSDQSYLQGIGDLVKTLQGDPYSAAQSAAAIPSQLIPLGSLQSWVNTLIDPLYRKGKSGLSLEAIGDTLKKKIIGLEETLPPQTDTFGRPSKRTDKEINAFSPVNIKTADEVMEEVYKAKQKGKQIKKSMQKKAEDLREQAMQNYSKARGE